MKKKYNKLFFFGDQPGQQNSFDFRIVQNQPSVSKRSTFTNLSIYYILYNIPKVYIGLYGYIKRSMYDHRLAQNVTLSMQSTVECVY